MSERVVLVVEDNPLNLELVTDLLEMAGYRVESSPDARQGFEAVKKVHPDIVLMDISLPDVDGLTATRWIKGDPDLRDIPVVALTAQAMEGDDLKAKEAGCDGYVTKPINVATFVSTISEFLRQ